MSQLWQHLSTKISYQQNCNLLQKELTQALSIALRSVKFVCNLVDIVKNLKSFDNYFTLATFKILGQLSIR